ncbi:uncharacterized protein LOC6726951 isoform X2 [Drosophila simulans]|uniref:Uncharacterized protein LOC117144617 isoform X2 n=1 Tax=Drosophila mauritiana TaxID=7226 RepID=A0A6P8KAF5_DROMA|nr:uncharacterized protein LOC6726951 isoform X2 [Drosophila simulans]XP_033165803.1 uncharacterized protein LOC117144617 isoform X2 [Drosophila mauritiana]KMZ01815.1 uncharacterized protein Dsimw501_GD19862, isoform B [Drosophila simulans]
MAKLLLVIVGVAALVAAGQAAGGSTEQMQRLIAEEQSKCASGQDSMACIKERAMRFVDNVMSKDSFQVSNLEVRTNGVKTTPINEARASSADGFLDAIENYIRGHDVSMDLPLADAKVTVSARNLVNNQLSLNLQLNGDEGDEGTDVEARGKKHRLRKLAMPILVLILLKAITVIPMAIGILKIKAFNALALGFFSFIVSVGLAIFQLCKKIAHDHHHTAHITAHGPWDGRTFGSVPAPVVEQPQKLAQTLAYQAYV